MQWLVLALHTDRCVCVVAVMVQCTLRIDLMASDRVVVLVRHYNNTPNPLGRLTCLHRSQIASDAPS